MLGQARNVFWTLVSLAYRLGLAGSSGLPAWSHCRKIRILERTHAQLRAPPRCDVSPDCRIRTACGAHSYPIRQGTNLAERTLQELGCVWSWIRWRPKMASSGWHVCAFCCPRQSCGGARTQTASQATLCGRRPIRRRGAGQTCPKASRCPRGASPRIHAAPSAIAADGPTACVHHSH